MGAPAGFLPLGLVGFTDRGEYNATTIYMMNDLAHVNNAIWKCKVDNTIGIAPGENANWEIWIQSSTELTGIMAVDDSGVLGAAGQVVVSQELISAMANMVMKELVKKTQIVNNLLATDTSTVLSGPMGKQLAEKDAELQKQINDQNSNFPYKLVCRVFNTQTGTIAIKAGETKSVAVDLSADGQYCDGFFCSFSGGMIVDQLYNGSIANYTIGLKNTSNVDISLSGRIFYLVK